MWLKLLRLFDRGGINFVSSKQKLTSSVANKIYSQFGCYLLDLINYHCFYPGFAFCSPNPRKPYFQVDDSYCLISDDLWQEKYDAGPVCACFHNSNFANEKVSPYIWERREPTSILFCSYTNYSIWCSITLTVQLFCVFLFRCKIGPRLQGRTLFCLSFGEICKNNKKLYVCAIVRTREGIVCYFHIFSGQLQ